MMNEQVLNLTRDNVIAIDAEDVIDDTTQVNIGKEGIATSILVTVDLWDLISNSHVGPFASIPMTYRTAIDHWTIAISHLIDGVSGLIDRRKYVAYVSSSQHNMRSFKITEFVVDNDSFEDALMRLPYQVEIGSPVGEAWIRWYPTVSDFNNESAALYAAAAYEGGTGVIFATDPARVTHRGPVVTLS